MEHLTALDWKDSETTFVWVRAGCLAANCTSTKAVDGISRLLVKSDLDKLKQPSRRDDIKKAEKLCSLAWETLSKAQLHKNKKGLTILGRLLVRVALVLAGKSGKGREKKAFRDLQEVNDAFVADLGKLNNPESASAGSGAIAAGDVPTDDSALVSLQARPHVQVSTHDSIDMISLWRLMLKLDFVCHIHRFCVWQEASSRAHIAKEKYHLELTKYYHRKNDPADKVWQLMSFGDESCLFEHQPFWGERESTIVPFAELKNWKVCTLDAAPRLFPPEMITDLLQHTKYHFEQELEKAQVQAAVAKLFLDTDLPEIHMEKKSGLYTKKQYNKGTLRLVPVGVVQRHYGEKLSKNCTTVQCGSSVYIVKAPSMCEKEHAKNMMCPFFHVQESEEDSEVNMEKSTVKFEGCIIPILKNKRQLPACTAIKIESSAPKTAPKKKQRR